LYSTTNANVDFIDTLGLEHRGITLANMQQPMFLQGLFVRASRIDRGQEGKVVLSYQVYDR
jgi:hypothetical protein